MISLDNTILLQKYKSHVKIIWRCVCGINDTLCKWNQGLVLFAEKIFHLIKHFLFFSCNFSQFSFFGSGFFSYLFLSYSVFASVFSSNFCFLYSYFSGFSSCSFCSFCPLLNIFCSFHATFRNFLFLVKDFPHFFHVLFLVQDFPHICFFHILFLI